jgi:Zn-dependent oligopeptidase
MTQWIDDLAATRSAAEQREMPRRFAVHHETKKVIPRELVDSMRVARDFGRGLWVRHQMFYAAVSYFLHRESADDLTATQFGKIDGATLAKNPLAAPTGNTKWLLSDNSMGDLWLLVAWQA